jgi:hypothetical protein
MSYRPNPDKLDGKVVGFFALNPDECLSLEDVIEKFVDRGDTRNVHGQLMAALDHDLLAWDGRLGVYSRGPVPMPSVLEEKPMPDLKPARRRMANNFVDLTPKVAVQEDRDGGSQGSDAADVASGGDREDRPGGSHHSEDLRHPEPKSGLEEGGPSDVGGDPWTFAVRNQTVHSESCAAQDGREHGCADSSPDHGSELDVALSAERGGVDSPQGVDHLRAQAQSGIELVRKHLLDTLNDLRDKANPMALDRAKVVAEVATVLVNSAKVEVDYLRATNQLTGPFFEREAIEGAQA